MDVLVLTHTWRPDRRVSWQTAFRWIFSGRAEVIESYTDRLVRSARDTWPMPSVIRFLRKVSRRLQKRRITFSRRNVWLRDGGRCQYCARAVTTDAFTYDHVVPRSRGGGTSWQNIVVSCLPCNQHKAARTPDEAGMRLAKTPVRPRSLPDRRPAQLAWQAGMPRSWQDYLGSVAWWTEQLE